MKTAHFIASLFVLFVTLSVWCQPTYPKASPFSKIEQQIGLTSLNIEYSRPAVRGRQLFGKLIPYGRIWRVGANESTKFSTNKEITILGNKLSPGTYALYAFPEEDVWEVVFHKNTTHWGDGRTAYDAAEDAFRVRIKLQENIEWQENFLISFDSITHNGAVMQWKWGTRKISVPMEAGTQKEMLHTIEEHMKGSPTAQDYYEAARYFQEEGIANETALGYLEKAIALGGDTYYYYRVKSLVEAAVKNYSAAIVSAQRSLTLAQAEGKDEFVRMNKENIARWKELE
ncbi:MAG: DUF2911 domain-containing protein [Muriicola sp.]